METVADTRAGKIYEKQCVVCGRWFLANMSTKVCCSDKCRAERNKRIKSEYWEKYGRIRKREYWQEHGKSRNRGVDNVKENQNWVQRKKAAEMHEQAERIRRMKKRDASGYQAKVTHRTATGECGRRWKVEERR